MARISLRTYNADIETMIDRDQSDEAIAHCRYILERYPKHIDTYRLMGKALLESQRFGDASDVFHRVLSSVPDDFIAHLGMSIIREDENNLDAAIWHMERSFEVQPSNAAVQVELRRLFNLRDGLTPQKIQLTRGALARMSAKSNLYSQAIAELRAALSDDPQRPDLQVVLAAMYALSGSRMEAIETCNTLISKLPYCFEANRILAEILPETEVAEKAQEYKHRLIELDPYFAHISPASPTVDQVTDGAVTIERFEYSGEAQAPGTPDQPEWATSLGVSIEEEAEPEGDLPPWMVDKSDEILPAEEVLQEKEPEPITEPESDEQQVEEAPLPGWITETESEEASIPDDEVETPAWLRDVMEGSSEAEIDEGVELDRVQSDQIEDESAVEEGDIAAQPEEDTATIGSIPTGAVAGAALAGAAMAEDDDARDREEIPQEMPGEDLPEIEMESVEELGEHLEPEGTLEGAEVESEVPDWLVDLSEGLPEEEESEVEPEIDAAGESVEEEPISSQLADEEIDIESLVIETAQLDEEEPVESESAPAEEIVESLAEAADATIPQEEAGEPILDSLEELDIKPEIGAEEFETLMAFDSADQTEEGESLDTLPDWLSAVFPEDIEGVIDTGTTKPSAEGEIVRAEIPDWLKKMEQQHLAEMAAATTAAKQLEEFELETDFTDLGGEDVPSWLMAAMATEVVEEKDEVTPVDDIKEIISGPEVLDAEPVETFIKDESVDVPEAELEDISAEQVREEIIPETAEVETEEEYPDEIVPEEETMLESDTQPMMVGEPAGADELDDEHIVSETILSDLPEAEIAEGEEIPVSDEAVEIQPEIEVTEEIETEDLEVDGVPEISVETPLSSEDEDAAMAWLESLAARQGAAEEELLTAPEQRQEEPPGWIQEEALEAGDEEVEEPELVDDLAKAALAGAAIASLRGDDEEEVSQEELPPVEPEISPTETTEWIPELEQEFEETPIDVEPELTAEEEYIQPVEVGTGEEELTQPEALDEVTEVTTEPELMEDKDEEPVPLETAEIITEESTEEEIPEWLTELAEEEETQPVKIEAEQVAGEQAEEEIPEWLAQLGEEEETQPEIIEEEFEEPTLRIMAEQVKGGQAEEEIPDWLTDLTEEEELTPEYQTTDWSPEMLVEKPEPGLVAEPEPDVKIDLNAASLAQLERIPGVGFIHAQNVINYRASAGPFNSLDELEQVPDLAPEVIDALKANLTVEVVGETLPPVPAHRDLQKAWDSITSGDIESGVQQYDRLIKKDEYLDQIIRDLQEALGKYPSDASLYQTLGDAYLRTNMLEEALEAYNRAEDLIG